MEVMNVGNLKIKWEGFGWESIEIDGHRVPEIFDSLSANVRRDNPFAIIANTIKGKGVSFSQDDNEWHHAVMTRKLYNIAVEEVCSMAAENT